MNRSAEQITAELRAAKDAGDSQRVDELLEELHAVREVDQLRRAIDMNPTREQRG